MLGWTCGALMTCTLFLKASKAGRSGETREPTTSPQLCQLSPCMGGETTPVHPDRAVQDEVVMAT